MDRAKPVSPVAALSAAAQSPLVLPIELMQQAASRAALDALETALAAAHEDGALAAVADRAKSRADEAVRAAEYARRQLSALDTLARMAALVDGTAPPAKGR